MELYSLISHFCHRREMLEFEFCKEISHRRNNCTFCRADSFQDHIENSEIEIYFRIFVLGQATLLELYMKLNLKPCETLDKNRI